MKTDKLLQLIQQKRVMRSGGALPLPKAQKGILLSSPPRCGVGYTWDPENQQCIPFGAAVRPFLKFDEEKFKQDALFGKPQIIQLKDDSLESKINESLGDPMGRAALKAEQAAGEGEDPIDNYRHALAGMYTAEGISNSFPKWMQYTGIPQTVGFLGSTGLGIAHELQSNAITQPNKYPPGYTLQDVIRESLEDGWNNTRGAWSAVSPIMIGTDNRVILFPSHKQKEDHLYNLSRQNYLPDGYAKGDMYFKKEGGPLHKAQPGKQVSVNPTNVRESTSVNIPKFNDKLVGSNDIQEDGFFTPDYGVALANKLLKDYNVKIDSTGNILKDIGLPSGAYYNPVTRTIHYDSNANNSNTAKRKYVRNVIQEVPHAIQADRMGAIPFLVNIGIDALSDPSSKRYYKKGTLENEAHHIIVPQLEDKIIKQINVDTSFSNPFIKRQGGSLPRAQTGIQALINQALNQNRPQPSSTATSAPVTAKAVNKEFRKSEDVDKLSDEAFKDKYGEGKHKYKYRVNPAYKAEVDADIKRAQESGAPMIKERVEVNPNNMWMVPGSGYTPEMSQSLVDQNLDVIGAALPIPGLETVGKVPGLFKTLSKATKQALVPLKYRSEIADITKMHNEFFDLAKTEEGRRRLKSIGVNPDNFTSKPKLTFKLNESNSYTPEFFAEELEIPKSGNGIININFNELKKIGANHRSVYDHELGHYLGEQSTLNSPSYKKRLKNYKDNVDRLKANLKKWESLTPEEQKDPANMNIYYDIFMNAYAPSSIRPTSIDIAASALDPSVKKLKGSVYDLEEMMNAGWMPKDFSPEANYSYFNQGFLDNNWSTERFAHIREMKRNMVNQGVIKDIWEPVTNKQVFEFINKNQAAKNGDRIASFADTRPHSIQLLTNILNTAPMVTVPLIGAAAASQYQKRDGGLAKAQDGTIDPYIGMRKFYDDAYSALDKYKNKEGEVSPFNVNRAWVKAAIKNPYLLFRDRHNLAEQGIPLEDIMSKENNPYHKDSPVIRVNDAETRYQHPTDYVVPNERDVARYNKYLQNQNQPKGDGFDFDLSDEWKDIKRGVRNASRDVRHFIGKEIPRALRNCVNGNCYEFHRDGGPLHQYQAVNSQTGKENETGSGIPWWILKNPALFLSGFVGDNKTPEAKPVETKPTRAPFDYDTYSSRANAYLSRPVFKGTPLTGQMIADSARDFYNQTGYEYPLDFLLSQGQFETGLGTKLKSKNNFFNIGNFDDGRKLDYKTPQESINAYLNLIYNDYMNKGQIPADQLLQPGKFVNTEGKRYASNPNYEKNLADQSSYIRKSWAKEQNEKLNSQKKIGGSLTRYQILGEKDETKTNIPQEVKHYMPVPKDTIFPDQAWTSDVIDPTTGQFISHAKSSIPQIFDLGITTLNPKKSDWTADQEIGANTEGIVEKLKFSGDSAGPNIYRETGTQCRKPNGEVIPECASGIQLAMDYGTDMGGENRKRLGITGDAWTMGQNVVDAGGQRYYNLIGDNLNKSSLNTNKDVKNYLDDRRKELGIKPLDIYNSAQAGDLVEMWYENSPNQSKALNEGKGALTTHIGVVSIKDGKKYITHNIHGHWESNPLEKAISRKINVKEGSAVMVAGLVRPDYLDNSRALETVGIQISPKARVYSSSSEETKRTPREIEWKTKTPLSRESQIFTRSLAAYAPQVQQDFGLSDQEMEEIMKTSFGLFGKESGFAEGDTFKKKQKWRKLINKYKDISPDWDYEGDEMSVGKGQIKMDEVFNTPEKKALLEKYGITKDNIWDTGNSAAALLLTTAMNYKNLSGLIGTTFENTDAVTLKNILALSHNKGLKAVIENEFVDNKGNPRRDIEKVGHLLMGDKNWNNEWDESPTLTAESILKGLDTYSSLHSNPESYSNIFQDYAASLNIDYNKIKENFANKENFEQREESIPQTIVDVAGQGINNIVEGATNEINSTVDKGERAARKAVRVPKKVVSKIRKELRRTPIFEDGGLMRAQDGRTISKNPPREGHELTYNRYYDPAFLQTGLDLGQFIPGPIGALSYGLSIPFTVKDMLYDIAKGDLKGLGKDAIGLIPTFKAARQAGKTATQLKKINNIIGVGNTAVDVEKIGETNKKAKGGPTSKNSNAQQNYFQLLINQKNKK